MVNWECICDSNSPSSSSRRGSEAERIQIKICAADKMISESAKMGGPTSFVLGHILTLLGETAASR